MSKSYATLLKEIKVMQAHAEVVKARELVSVIARIKEAIKAYSITMNELYVDASAASRAARASVKMSKRLREGKLVVKYADGNGNVWGGRGPRPLWLREALAAGKALSDFEV